MKFPSDQGSEMTSAEIISLEVQQISVVEISKRRIKVFIEQND